MSKRKQLSIADLSALATYADDKVHEIWEADQLAQGSVEATPTLAQIAAFERLGTAYHLLVGTLLTHARMADCHRGVAAGRDE